MPTVNIKNIPESKIVKLVDLSEDSINKIAEAVAQKIAIDAVKVVRCKDCKWWNSYEESCFGQVARANDFCSWAERKKDQTQAHWIIGFNDMTCSHCGTWFPNDRASYMRYCPYCQAKMENVR